MPSNVILSKLKLYQILTVSSFIEILEDTNSTRIHDTETNGNGTREKAYIFNLKLRNMHYTPSLKHLNTVFRFITLWNVLHQCSMYQLIHTSYTNAQCISWSIRPTPMLNVSADPYVLHQCSRYQLIHQ
jgi:hypothetical protein